MTEKRFKHNGSLIFDDKNPMGTIDVVDLLNEQHEQIQEFDLFKLKVSMAIQHRINWLQKQIWDNRDRINELQSLKKELKL